MTTKHRELVPYSAANVGAGIHTVLAARPANAAARGAYAAMPGGAAFTDAIDIGKVARDADTGRLFMLTGVGPVVWTEVLSADTDCTAANLASATLAGFMSAADFVRTYGTVAATTSVPLGAGYTTIATSVALIAANNTSRNVSFAVTHNRALASLVTAAGSAAFMVARLNDGTQTIMSLATGLAVTGAAPVTTGTLVSGVGWQATLNANGTVTFDLARNAGFDRSATCRYWYGDLVTQVAP